MDLQEIKSKLLKLPDCEKKERIKVKIDYAFYKGKCTDFEKAKYDKTLLGQNWDIKDNIDYIPTQDIRNKVKPLLKKQARFMFGKEPTINFKPDDLNEKLKCEELRRFVENIFDQNKFWKNTRKAFLISTIKKRVLLRLEANPNKPIQLKYESIENFYYKEINDKLVEVSFFEEDLNNIFIEDTKDMLFYLHTYYYKAISNNDPAFVWYKKQTFKGDNLETPINEIEINTGFLKLPCWLIKNCGSLNDEFGESDIEDLRDIQEQYNRRISDYADALKFQFFGADSIIDGNPQDVNNLKIAPGALNPIRTHAEALEQGKQAIHQKLEYNFGNNEAINRFLDRAVEDLNFIMDMPSLKDLHNVPSAKAMKYLYNDLIARCEEKFNEWDPVFIDVIEFIKEVARTFYFDYKKEWDKLNYSIVFTHNYPLPSDEEDKKKLGIEEVKNNVRSIQSYMQELSNEENPEQSFKEIIEEKKILAETEMIDSFQSAINTELNNNNNKTSLNDEEHKDVDGDS